MKARARQETRQESAGFKDTSATRGKSAVLDLTRIKEAAVTAEPFSYFAVEQVLAPEDLAAIRADFPQIGRPGIFPLSELDYGPRFAALIEAIRSPELAQILSQKFGIGLTELPQMITVRGQAQKRDGRIHTDSRDKIVTCLLYLNPEWDSSTGRLRLLRNGHDLEDYLTEIPPHGGTLVAFKVSDRSWHGHHPYVGERRYVMFNWVRSEAALSRHISRHKLSAKIKRLNPFA